MLNVKLPLIPSQTNGRGDEWTQSGFLVWTKPLSWAQYLEASMEKQALAQATVTTEVRVSTASVHQPRCPGKQRYVT